MSPTDLDGYPRVLHSDLVLAIVIHDLDAVLYLNDLHVPVIISLSLLTVVRFHDFW
jgi:hypothetical protein